MGFDAAGRMTGLEDASGLSTWGFDAAGRMTSAAAPGGILTHGFDAAGNRITMDDPAGRSTWGYDADNRVERIVNPYGERTTLLHDALGREWRKTLANGMTVSHLYDPAGRETVLEVRKASGEALAVYTASYDAVGNRQTALELDGVRVTYGYDAANQLVNEQRSGANAYNTSYLYDSAANRLQKVDSGQTTQYQYCPDSLNRKGVVDARARGRTR